MFKRRLSFKWAEVTWGILYTHGEPLTDRYFLVTESTATEPQSCQSKIETSHIMWNGFCF